MSQNFLSSMRFGVRHRMLRKRNDYSHCGKFLAAVVGAFRTSLSPRFHRRLPHEHPHRVDVRLRDPRIRHLRRRINLLRIRDPLMRPFKIDPTRHLNQIRTLLFLERRLDHRTERMTLRAPQHEHAFARGQLVLRKRFDVR